MAGNLNYVKQVGDNLLAQFADGERIIFAPSVSGYWRPIRQQTPPKPPEPEPVPEPTPEPTPEPGPVPDSGTGWVHPLPGSTLTSGYGPRGGAFHAGQDWSTGGGRDILAPTDLKITVARELGTGGLYDAGSYVKGWTVHGIPYTFNFFHMVAGSIAVAPGMVVARGTRLGIEGNTGNSFGAHLHVEIWPGHLGPGSAAPVGDGPWYWGDGTPPDPLPLFRANGVAV